MAHNIYNSLNFRSGLGIRYDFGMILGSCFIWFLISLILKRSQNYPKMIPNWCQNYPNIILKWSQTDPKMIPKWFKHLFTIALMIKRKKLSPKARKKTWASESPNKRQKNNFTFPSIFVNYSPGDRAQKVIPGGAKKNESFWKSQNNVKK